jgi:hypothetical protein
MRLPFASAFLVALALACGSIARAASVLPLDLDRIVGDSSVAFQGTVTDVHAERDAQTGWIVTFVTFRVDDALKGPVGTTYTVKQIGGRLPDGESYRVDGVPSYTVGQSYVVFLTSPSSIGLSSPVGLSQGRFSIAPGAAGAEVSNGRDFRELTANIPAETLPPTARARIQRKAGGKVRSLPLDEFKTLVRERMGAR